MSFVAVTQSAITLCAAGGRLPFDAGGQRTTVPASAGLLVAAALAAAIAGRHTSTGHRSDLAHVQESI